MPALFDPDGRYGRWNMTGIAVYAFGVLIQMPFIATGFYTGALADALGGVDISWIVGLIAPALLYYLVARLKGFDVPDEMILPPGPGVAD